jgi:hypothetical protein
VARVTDFIVLSRHDPIVGPQHLSIALCSMISVVWDTLGQPLRRFNGHTHRWWSPEPYRNIYMARIVDFIDLCRDLNIKSLLVPPLADAVSI